MKRLLNAVGMAVVLVAMVAGLLGSSAVRADAQAESSGPSARACRGLDTSSTSPWLRRRWANFRLHQRCLKLNQVQVMGSHNSYKQPTTPEILELLFAFDQGLAEELEYSHPPIATALNRDGIRQIELDVFADPEGGHLAGRVGLDVAGLPNEPVPELLEPGFKVLHVQELDFNSSCLTLITCLRHVLFYSGLKQGNHLPITIMIEMKTQPIPDPLDLGFVEPLPIGPAEFDALDAEIRSVFPEEYLITPDDVRGNYPTLEAAVLAGNWPTLEESRGKVMFLMDNGGQSRDDYRAGRPSLEGRVLFTNSLPGEDDAAFVKVNNPIGNVERIQQLVADGYVVRTRSDSPTDQARSGDTTQLDAALESGAQWVSTDYPVAGRSPFSDYVAQIPNGKPARCNPINTGPRCRNGALERLRNNGRGRP